MWAPGSVPTLAREKDTELQNYRWAGAGGREHVRGLCAGERDETLHDNGIELRAAIGQQSPHGFFMRQTLPVGTVGDHGVVGYGSAQLHH